MSWAVGSGTEGSGTGRWPGRCRDIETIDLDTAHKAVCTWLDEHEDGTLARMVDELKNLFPEGPEEMAVVLRDMMAAELRRRTQPGTASPVAGVPR